MKYKSFKIIVLAIFVLIAGFSFVQKIEAVGPPGGEGVSSIWPPSFTVNSSLSADQNTLTYSTVGNRSGSMRVNCGDFTPFQHDANGYNWGGYIGGYYVDTPYLMDNGTAAITNTTISGIISSSDIIQQTPGRAGDALCNDSRRYSYYDNDPYIDNGIWGTFTTVAKTLNVSSLPNGTYTLAVTLCAENTSTSGFPNCGGDSQSFTISRAVTSYTVSASAGSGGSVTATAINTGTGTVTPPNSANVNSGATLKFTLSPLAGYTVDTNNVTSTYGTLPAGGTWSNLSPGAGAPDTYTTGALPGAGTYTFSFIPTPVCPTVTTRAITNITPVTATGGGNTVSNGGAVVTQAGLVWGGAANPTITSHAGITSNGWADPGDWTSNMAGLQAYTPYHVRAYATNSVCTAYGADVTFMTLSAPNLVAAAPPQNTATIDVGQTYTSVISNIGSVATNSPGVPTGTSTGEFPYFFQLSMTANGGGSFVSEAPYGVMTTLASGGSNTATSPVITIGVAGIYSIRACADQSTQGNIGVINETNENDNCSPWTNITVGSGSCSNSANNPPTCNTCTAPLTWDAGSSSCVSSCSNNANNPPTCNTCTAPLTWDAGSSSCVSACSNNANNPPTCNTCTAPLTWDAGTGSCISAGLPDLTASAPTPTVAAVSVATTFSSTISNIGAVTTGASFSNFFQVATAANGGGVLTDLASASTLALAGGSTRTITKSYTFPITGTYSIRTCADKTNRNNLGVIAESNEGNNCSPTWTNVTVATAAPDLTASAPTPTTATPGVAQTYTSTISNIGTVTTGAGFTNLFQISSFSDGRTPTNYTTTTASAVGAGGTTNTSKSITLAAGTYYMRVCADATITGGVADFTGTITESNEANNCSTGAPSPWTAVTVGVACSVLRGNSCSVSNSCGSLTNLGTLGCDGVTCSATPPDESVCPGNDGNGVGACGTAHYSCTTGTPGNKQSTTSKWTWVCGTTTCTELKTKPTFKEN